MCVMNVIFLQWSPSKRLYMRTIPLVAYQQQPDFLFDLTFRFFSYWVFVTKTKAARSWLPRTLSRLKQLQIHIRYSVLNKLQVYFYSFFAGDCDDNTSPSSLISSNETLSSSSSETAETAPVKCRTPGELVPNTQNCRWVFSAPLTTLLFVNNS